MSWIACFYSLVAILAGLFFPATLRACAVCLTAVSGSDPVADAFNWSVLFLMAMPYTVVGSIGGWLYYTYRRTAARKRGLRTKKTRLQLARIQKESAK